MELKVKAAVIIYKNSPIKRALRGWSLLYHWSCIDPTHQSHALDPAPDVPLPILLVPIRLLDKDVFYNQVVRPRYTEF